MKKKIAFLKALMNNKILNDNNTNKVGKNIFVLRY